MPRKHAVNDTGVVHGAVALGSFCEIRCVCGALILTGRIGDLNQLHIDQALDKHLITILDTQYITQFITPSGG